MNQIEEVSVQDIISDSLSRSVSYDQYREEMKAFVANKSTSGNEKTEVLIDYTVLNDRRMRRWDKTVKVSDEVKAKVVSFKRNVTWLVVTESWCGDAAHVIPVIHKMAELFNDIDLRIVYRDENESLMNEFLTNGSKSIPKLIMIDNQTKEVIDTFGPRPHLATELVLDYKAKHGVLTPKFKEELQHWYNIDKGQNTIEDLVGLLKV